MGAHVLYAVQLEGTGHQVDYLLADPQAEARAAVVLLYFIVCMNERGEDSFEITFLDPDPGVIYLELYEFSLVTCIWHLAFELLPLDPHLKELQSKFIALHIAKGLDIKEGALKLVDGADPLDEDPNTALLWCELHGVVKNVVEDLCNSINVYVNAVREF